MKRIDINLKQTHFIGCWNLENKDLCNEIINFFDDNKDLHHQGQSGMGKNLKIKNSIDMTVKPNELKIQKYKILEKYIGELHKCYLDYLKQWSFLQSMLKDIDIGQFNIQKYNPGGHFSGIHSERTSLTTLHRLFAWMTYLNNVEDGGETSFVHYGIKIKPEVGKTLIWPAEWTHAHTGELVKSGTKYIVTGWMHFPSHEKNI